MAFSFVSSPVFNQKILPSMGVQGVDGVARATGGAGGGAGIPDSLRPNREDILVHGEDLPEEDKGLPYESDFIESVSYNNKYGYLILNVNKDMLKEGFVNGIDYIGINDKKYKYEDINKDKAHWYKIFIPYRFIEEGQNDMYFYMGEDKYKVSVETGEDFKKQKTAPTIIPEENVDGVDSVIQLKLHFDDEEQREDYYNHIREDLADRTSIIEILTATRSETEVKKEDYDVSLDEEKDLLTIQFKNGKQTYKSLYVYNIQLDAEGFNTAYTDVILYDHPVQLESAWDTEGDYSLHIRNTGDGSSLYFSELTKIELSELSNDGKVVEKRVLKKGEDYESSYGDLKIFASAFQSNKKYRLTLTHPSVVTMEEEVESPALPEVKKAFSFLLKDINPGEALQIPLTEEELAWFHSVTERKIIDQNGYEYPLKPISEKEKDEEALGGNSRKNKNKYYRFDEATGTLTIPGEYNKDSGSYTLVLKAAGYEDSEVSYRVKSKSFFGETTYKAEFLTDGDYSLDIYPEEGMGMELLRTYSNKYGKYSGPSVSLMNKKTGEIKPLSYDDGKGYQSVYKDSKTHLLIPASQFEKGTEYTIFVQKSGENSFITEITVPEDLPTLQKAAIQIPPVTKNGDFILKGDEDYLDSIRSITVWDSREYNYEIPEDDFHFKEGAIHVSFEKAFPKKSIRFPEGKMRYSIRAEGYEELSGKFTILKDALQLVSRWNSDSGYLDIGFRDQGGISEYDVGETITSVSLNGKKLERSQYVIGALSTLSIHERYLEDGVNRITVQSSLYPEMSTAYSYNNEKLRTEKAALLEDFRKSKYARELSRVEREMLMRHIQEAKTLRELRSEGISFSVSKGQFEKSKKVLKTDLEKEITKSALPDTEKTAFLNQLKAADSLKSLQELDKRFHDAVQEKKIADAEKAAEEAKKEAEEAKKQAEEAKKEAEEANQKAKDANQELENLKNRREESGKKTEQSGGSIGSSATGRRSSFGNSAGSREGQVLGASRATVAATPVSPSGAWKLLSKIWYFYNPAGKALTGWNYINNKWYYMNEKGEMLAATWVQTKEKWYCLGQDGAMLSSTWVQANGKWYYLGQDGAMLKNTVTPDGYKLDASGAWVK